MALISDILDCQTLAKGDCSSVVGKLFFFCTSCFNRVGRAALEALITHRKAGEPGIGPAVVASLTFFAALLAYSKPRMIYVYSNMRRVLRVWTDAMYEDGIGRLGWVAYDELTYTTYYSASS